MEQVILVDEKDNAIGTMEKMEAHRCGALHRAFSVFIFNSNHQMLLQRRAGSKYHSAGLWSNTCCSHPRPGEATALAAARRLKEEMGIETDLQHVFSFTYQLAFENGLTEHEYDHVFAGFCNDPIQPNPSEVSAYAWKGLDEIAAELAANPGDFTGWFRIAFPEIREWKLGEPRITQISTE